ncbi:phosphotransferase [Brevibacterium album]|uniref:phosphotransferase n=1 Tax=Brevibacterium album TaxID=417948 RepID=UPI00040C1733|nr:phosphotransferase [Brevibacterium album]
MSGAAPGRAPAETITVHADDADGRRRNRLEVYGRRWAAAQGVPVPQVIEAAEDGSRFVGRRIRALPSEGRAYVDAALESAALIAAGAAPRPPAPATTWRHPDRRRTAVRAVQLAAAGISPVRFAAARAAANRLPSAVPSHFDFHTGNVLLSAAAPGPAAAGTDAAAFVIDFEYLRMGPAHADALRLLTTVPRAEDAEYGLDLLLRTAPAREWPGIAAQLRWLALRPLAEFITAEDPQDPHRVARARRRWALGRAWAQDIERAHGLASRRAGAAHPSPPRRTAVPSWAVAVDALPAGGSPRGRRPHGDLPGAFSPPYPHAHAPEGGCP